jgi:pimeloyl-ACP methyl ester carboxylesterase
VTVVFVHGLPETRDIWRPLQEVLGWHSVAVALPGFGAARRPGFAASKDAYARWLSNALGGIDPPIDVVGHDLGALLTMRVASAGHGPCRSWAVDVANLFHPRFRWPERTLALQTRGLGEEILKTERELDADDLGSTASRLLAAGVPGPLAREIAAHHDEAMSRSILDFYRSAVPNVAADWWKDVSGPTRSQGLVLLLPDPPEDEAMSLEVAGRLGAATARLDALNHCWMAEAPQIVASVLHNFWSSLA